MAAEPVPEFKGGLEKLDPALDALVALAEGRLGVHAVGGAEAAVAALAITHGRRSGAVAVVQALDARLESRSHSGLPSSLQSSLLSQAEWHLPSAPQG